MKKNHYSLKGFPLVGNDYRPFCWYWFKHYLDPVNYWRTVKYFCQRGWRGYADCDHWDSDGYMESVMLGTIKLLREHTHGYPSGLTGEVNSLPDNKEEDPGFVIWKGVLTEIIDGLEAGIDLRHENSVPEGVYSDQPLVFEDVPDQPGFSRLVETDTPRFDQEKWEEWAAPLRKKKLRAMYLLRKHWGSFWD